MAYTPEQIEAARQGAKNIAKKNKGKQWGAPVVREWGRPQKPLGPIPNYGKMAKQGGFQPGNYDVDTWRDTLYKQQFDPTTQQPTNPVKGINGEDLPKGAVAWDPNGDPWFGGGLPGFWNKLVYNFNREPDIAPDEIVVKKPTVLVDGKLPDVSVPYGGRRQPSYIMPAETLQVLPTINNMFQALYANTGVPGKVARTVQGAVKTGLDVISAPAKEAEKVSGVAQELEKMGNESILPNLNPTRASQALIGMTGLKIPEGSKNAAAMPWNVQPQGILYNAMRAALAPGTVGQKMDRLERAYYASQMLYSSFADNTLRAEYDRRYTAGENPYLLALELENPLAEMAGQILIDPLNALGVGVKAARETKWLKQGEKLYTQVAPELDNIMRVAGNVDDIRAIEGVDEAVRIVQEATKAAETGLTDYANAVGWYTADAKKYQVGRRSGEFMGWLLRHAKDDPEAQVGALKAVVNLVSDNPDEVLDAMNYASHFPSAKPFFSQAGLETGVLLRNALKDESGVVNATKFLDDLATAAKGGVGDVVKMAASKMDGPVARMYPTITERIAAGEKVVGWQRALAKSEKVMKSIYRVPNTFFAGVYMGMSPGYAFRNLTTNTLHVAIDQGISSVFKKPTDAIRDTAEMLKGVPMGVGGFGRGLAGVDVGKVIAGQETLESGATFGKLIKERPLTPMLGVSEKFEEWGAAQTVYAATKRSFQKLFRPGKAIPEVAPLTAAGYSQAQANRVVQLIIDNKGDVDKALDLFRAEVKTGGHPLFRDMSIFDPNDLPAINNFNLDAETIDALATSASADEAVSKIARAFDRLVDGAKKVADDMPLVADTNPNLRDVMATVGHLPDDEVADISNYTQANMNAFDSMVDAIDRTKDGRYAQLLNKPSKSGTAETAQFNDFWGMTKTAARDLRSQAQKFGNDWHVNWERYVRTKPNERNIALWWQEMGMKTPTPQTWDDFSKHFWHEFYFPGANEYYVQTRKLYSDATKLAQKTFGDNTMLSNALKNDALADIYSKNVTNYQDVFFPLGRAIAEGRNKEVALLTAKKYGWPSITEKGVPLDKRILEQGINANLPKGVEPFTKLDDVPPAVAEKAFQKWARKKVGFVDEVAATAPAAEAIPVPYAGNTPTEARMLDEQLEGLTALRARMEDTIRQNWGRYEPARAEARLDTALNKWGKVANQQAAEARLLMAHVANANRDFTMLSYPDKSYMDLALAYIYPYHFWYTHTYTNWMRRIFSDPQVLAGYAKYKDALSKIHAGAPDWWKYNLNTNELLGLEAENPLYFNLEQTINPLNGLTGVDFNDQDKRINWWTTTLDDLSKLGPSTWTPFSLATAAALYMKGEEDAAARWGGRLFPQTATLKAALSLAGVKVKTGAGLNEFDPAVHFFSGGLDPYERNRAGRALATLQQERGLTDAEVVEAARTQDSPLWYEAIDKAIKQRAPGQLSGFFLGAGFKTRNESDIEIDQMYSDWRRMWSQKEILSPDMFRDLMGQMRDAYPFMDAVMLSRKGTEERDRAYAYNVMSRIPPGQLDDVGEMVGLTGDMLEKFWNDKGEMDGWAESDKDRFMAGIVDLGAYYEMPDGATRVEWNEAKTYYETVQDQGKQIFGDDIWDRENTYYAAKYDSGNNDAAEAILEADPELVQAMDWKISQIMQDPIASKYYTSMSRIEMFYRGQMNRLLEEKVGMPLDEMWNTYNDLKLTDKDASYKFYDKTIKEYYDWYDWYQQAVADSVTRIAEGLQDPVYPEIRPQAEQSLGTEALAQPSEPTIYERTWDEWRAEMSVPMANIVEDYAYEGKQPSDNAMKQLDFLAGNYYTNDVMLLEILADAIRRR